MAINRGSIIGLIIVLYSVLSIYAFPFLINNLGVAFLYFIIAPLLLFETNKQRGFKVVKSQKVLLIYILYLSIITLFSTQALSKSLISLILTSSIYVFLFSYKGFHTYLLKFYLFFAGAFSGFLILQYIAYFLAGVEISGIVSFLPLYEELESNGIIETLSFVRLASVFREPSHFALYVVPSVMIALTNDTIKRRNKYILLVLVTIATILSTSGNGIILLALSYILYSLSLLNERISFKNIFIVLIIVLGGIFAYSSSQFIGDTTEYLFVGSGNVGSKAGYRIYRGFELFNDLPIDNQMTGIGWKNAEAYLKSHNNSIYGKYSSDSAFDYFNSIAAILIYSGFIGALFFLGFVKSLWKECSLSVSRMLIIIMLASMVSSSIFMTDQWLLYLGLIYAAGNTTQNVRKYD